ncbi:MAG TPA: hypothetical protein VGS07_20660 [Thermoanaerobaculia bacterium]|jgi:hypothetical protein|nr:hypothetical protein [Thermoanaerobaculia bacterium]
MSIKQVGPEVFNVEIPASEGGAAATQGRFERLRDGAWRFAIDEGPGRAVEVQLKKSGPEELSGQLVGFGKSVAVGFNRPQVRAALERAKAGPRAGAALPRELSLPDGYLDFTREAARVFPGLPALTQGLKAGSASLKAVPRSLSGIAALLTPEALVQPEASIRISFGDEECDEIGEIAYEACGGGLLCRLLALYYDALCTILSAL